MEDRYSGSSRIGSQPGRVGLLPLDPVVNRISEGVIGAAIRVHRELGPGLLESAYHGCLALEMEAQGIGFEAQVVIPLVYRGVAVGRAYRVDFLVEGQVLVEIKAVRRLEPIFTAQVLTYLKLTGHRLGLLINFNSPLLKDGVRRIVL